MPVLEPPLREDEVREKPDPRLLFTPPPELVDWELERVKAIARECGFGEISDMLALSMCGWTDEEIVNHLARLMEGPPPKIPPKR